MALIFVQLSTLIVIFISIRAVFLRLKMTSTNTLLWASWLAYKFGKLTKSGYGKCSSYLQLICKFQILICKTIITDLKIEYDKALMKQLHRSATVSPVRTTELAVCYWHTQIVTYTLECQQSSEKTLCGRSRTGGFQPFIFCPDKVVFETRKKHVYFEYFVGISVNKEKKRHR